MKLTNNSKGPKAIHTTDRGVIVLQPGQTDNDVNMSDADAAALEKAGLLDADDGPSGPSLADLQREIASSVPVGEQADADSDSDDGLPAEDDADVVALVDSSSATELQQIAEDEKVDMAGARNKNDAARRIVAARRAAEGAPAA